MPRATRSHSPSSTSAGRRPGQRAPARAGSRRRAGAARPARRPPHRPRARVPAAPARTAAQHPRRSSRTTNASGVAGDGVPAAARCARPAASAGPRPPRPTGRARRASGGRSRRPGPGGSAPPTPPPAPRSPASCSSTPSRPARPFEPADGRRVLPAGEEAHVVGDRHRLDQAAPAAAAGARAVGPAGGGRTSGRRAARSPSPGPSRRASAVRARAARQRCAQRGARAAGARRPTSSSTVTGPASCRWPADAGRRRLVVGPECDAAAGAALRGHPAAVDLAGPAVGRQRGEPVAPTRPRRPARHQREQEVVQLVGVARRGAAPGRAPRPPRRGRARASSPAGTGQAVGPERAQAAAQRQRPGPALLERRAVEEREGAAAQDAVGERGRLRRLHRVHARSRPTPPWTTGRPGPRRERPSCRQSSTVWRASTWSGTATGPGGGVLLAGGQPGPHGGQEVVGLHPLEMDGPALAARSCAAGPAPG